MPENNYEKFLEFNRKILRKLKPRFSFHYIAYTILFGLVVFSAIQLVQATTPNPGHPWSELGDGVFTFTNSQTTTNYTYTFPAANTTVLTTNSAVTVAQGGTGLTSIASGSILAANSANTLSAVTSTSGTKVLTNTSGTITWETASSGMVYPGSGIAVSTGSAWGTSITASSGLISNISDEVGTGYLVFNDSPSFTTKITAPLVIGGTSTTSDLTLQTTSGVGTTGADMHFLVGNNGGTEAMTILNDGNVGIGTASPGTQLDVSAYVRTGVSLTVGSTSNPNIYIYRGGGSYGDPGIASNMYFVGGDGWYYGYSGIGSVLSMSSGDFTFQSSSAGTLNNHVSNLLTKMIIKNSGNVGIGETSPTAVLHLKAGTATAGTAPLKFTSGTNLTTPEAGAMEWNGTNLFITQTSGPTRKTIAYTSDITAQVYPGSGIANSTGSAWGTSYSTTGSGTVVALATTPTFVTNITSPLVLGGNSKSADLTLQVTSSVGEAGADMHFLVGDYGGTEAMTILNSGNVGIGTTSPSSLLTVGSIGTYSDVDLLVENGSTSANVSLSLTSDTFTSKINSFGDDGLLSFDTGGVNVANMWSTGRLGVGMSSQPGLRTEIMGVSGLPATSGTTQTGVLRLSASDGSQVLDMGFNNANGAGWLQTTNSANLGNYMPLILQPRGDNVGIGVTSPTALLHLKAGTATAGTAPLKLTSGTNLTTTEAGAIEYDGSHLYFTASNGGTRYQLDQQSGGSMTYPGSGIAVSTGSAWATSYSTTGSGTVVALATSPIFSTDITTPKILGGSTTTSSLTFQTTSGVGTTGADMHFLVGNNGGTEAMTILNDGKIGAGTTSPTYKLDVKGTATTDAIRADIGLDLYPVPTPTTLTGVPTAGTGLEIGDYVYQVTYYTDLGETNTKVSAVITTTSGNQQVTLTLPISSDPRVIGRKIYRNKVGTYQWTEYNLATIADNTTTTYVDSTPDASLTGLTGVAYYRSNTTSRYITVAGVKAMTIDQNLTTLGQGAGNSITTGGRNLFMGYLAGYNVTSGSSNTFIGLNAGYSNTTASSNLAMGYQAMRYVTTGSQNLGIGQNAVLYNVGGSYNLGIGVGALTGTSGNTYSYNMGIGTNSVYGLTTGSYNMGLGMESLYGLTTGTYNLALGYRAGRYIANGTTANTTSDYSIFLGPNTKALADNDQNEIVIGYNTTGAGSNTVTIGTSATTANYFTGIGSFTGGIITPKIYPSADSTTALQFNKADGSTNVMNIDTTNGYVGIGTTSPGSILDVVGSGTTTMVKVDAGTGDPLVNLSATGGDWYIYENNVAKSFGIKTSIGGSDVLTISGSSYVGNVGIGVSSPSAVLHLKAGTAAAGTAPLKLTAGTNLTTTEAGAIEYDGSHLYFTASNGGTRYQLDQQGGSMAIGGTITSATQGSILFAGASGVLAQNNAAFSWNNSTYGLYVQGNITIGKANMLKLNDSDESNYVAFQSPTAVSSDITWTLPSADSAGCFKSDGSGTMSIGACGDTNEQVFASNGSYSKPDNALMAIVELWGGGGGGGGGYSGAVGTVRSGGAGGGGGAYTQSIISGSHLASSVPITVGASGTAGTTTLGTSMDGGAGGRSCISSSSSCGGTVYASAYGGGGGNGGNGTAGSGGGGGGGALAVGSTNSTQATGGTGGNPLGASAGAANSGSGGAGGATAAATGAAGGAGYFGGAGGGSSSSTGAGNSGAGGGSYKGGSGGGAGGTIATAYTLRQGGVGGSANSASGGGGTAGTTEGAAGGAGADGVMNGGSGGGGGATGSAVVGGAGGAGGQRGGGGGGGGASNTTSVGAAGGLGGAGYVRVYTLRGAGADLAEAYGSFDDTLIAGEVVALDQEMKAGVKRTSKAYDSGAIGVISTDPGLIIGSVEDAGAEPVLVALSGRVPVKVNMENGPIHKGDYLTPSSEPGVAMRATKAGTIIGQAMTEYADENNPGYIVAFIKSGPSNGVKLTQILPGLSLDSTPSDESSDVLDSADATEEVVDEATGEGEEITEEETIQIKALQYFLANKMQLSEATEISEIYTDRLSAALEIITPTVITDTLSTNQVVVSTGEVIAFNSQAEFVVPPLFNSDTAGFALIKEGDKRVRVTYKEPYIGEPVVSADLAFNVLDGITDIFANDLFSNDLKYMIVDSDQEGFTILINQEAPRDLRFSWTALSVKDPEVFESVVEGLIFEEIGDSLSTSQEEDSTVETGSTNFSESDTTINKEEENQDVVESTDSASPQGDASLNGASTETTVQTEVVETAPPSEPETIPEVVEPAVSDTPLTGEVAS